MNSSAASRTLASKARPERRIAVDIVNLAQQFFSVGFRLGGGTFGRIPEPLPASCRYLNVIHYLSFRIGRRAPTGHASY